MTDRMIPEVVQGGVELERHESKQQITGHGLSRSGR